MRIWIALVVALLLSGCTTTRPERTAAVCASLDIASTAYAIEQGATETNVLYKGMDTYRVVMTSALLSVGMHYALKHLAKLTNTNQWLSFGPYAGLRCAAGLYNLGEVE